MAAHEGFGPALEVRREVGSWPLWPVGNTGECGSGAPRGLLGGRGWHGSFPCRRRCRCRSECQRGPRRGTWLVLAQNYVTAVTSPSGGMAGVCLRPRSEAPGRRAGCRAPSPLTRPRWRPPLFRRLAVRLVVGFTRLVGSAEPRPPPCTLPSESLRWGPESGRVCKALWVGPRGHRFGDAGHPFLTVSIAGAATCPRVAGPGSGGPRPGSRGVPSRGETLEVRR